MSQTAKDVPRRIETWPKEDQEGVAEPARDIEARPSRLYLLDDQEEAAIREGLAQLDREEWVDEEDMKVFWKLCSII